MARKHLTPVDMGDNPIINLADPTNDQDAVTKIYGTNNYLRPDGGSISGTYDGGGTVDIAGVNSLAVTALSSTVGSTPIVVNDGFDLGGTYKIVNLLDPTADQDAATKKYADKSRNVVAVVGPSAADYIIDGTADQVQINDAITAVNAAGGGTVLLRAGTYTTAATIVLKSNVKLVAEGRGSVVITGAASDYRLAGTTPSGQTKTVYENIEVRGVKFDSNYGTNLAIFNTTNVTVVDCEFTFSVTTPIRQGLYLQHCANIIITENYAHDYTGNGLSVTSSDYFVISNNIITGGLNGDDGIDVDFDFLDTSAIPSNYGTVTGNSVRSIGRGNGIRVENSNYVSVTGNSVDGVTSTASIAAGIIINTTSTNNGKGHTVTGNTVTNCDPGGIATSGTNLVDVSIVGNTIFNCGADSGSVRGGILLNSTGVNVASNLVDTTLKSGTDGAAMLIYKKDAHHIVDNIFRNSAVGVRFWNGDAGQSYTSTTFMNNRVENNTLQSVTAAVTAGSRLFNNFGLSDYGDMAKQAPGAVAITGGTITGITDLAIADGGTGASTAGAALTNLLPTQTGNSGKVLQTNGTSATWETASGGGITEEKAIAYSMVL